MYRALNLSNGQLVAVKRIELHGMKEEEIAAIVEEVNAVKELSHPSIVRCDGMVMDDTNISIILEWALSFCTL